MGNEVLIAKGTAINTIEYNFASGKSKSVTYSFLDKAKEILSITDVVYEFESGKPVASLIETYLCPLAKISKENSYLLEMNDDAVAGGKYWRLTLVASGTGADNLFFKKRAQTINAKPQIGTVNNVTINILDRAASAKLLKKLTAFSR